MHSSIRVKFFIGFLAVVFLAGFISLVAITYLSGPMSVSLSLIAEETPAVRLLWDTRTLVSEMEWDLEGLLLNQGQQPYLPAMWGQQNRISEFIAIYQRLHPTPPEELAQLLSELTTDYRSLQDATANIVTLVQQGESATAGALLLGNWQELQRATLRSVDRLFEYEESQVKRAAVLVQDRIRSGRIVILNLTVVGIFLSLALAFRISSSVVRPIRRLVAATERVARGDLESRTRVKREDEIGLLAQRFNEMIDQLNKSFEDQRSFYAEASHQLRTPLTIIRGVAEVALRGPKKSVDEYIEALENTVDVAGQMGRLVDELLFLARSEAKQIRYEMAEVPLGSLLEEVAHQGNGLAWPAAVQIEFQAQDEVIVWGDHQRLRELFLIFMDNAIKYTDPGGTITLALKSEPHGARVVVSDTGIGIPEKDLPHIFERFYQVETRRPRAGGSTGLGLSIAQSIIKVHKGEIRVESSLGRGTTFSILLPRALAQG